MYRQLDGMMPNGLRDARRAIIALSFTMMKEIFGRYVNAAIPSKIRNLRLRHDSKRDAFPVLNSLLYRMIRERRKSHNNY
jgi:hypothetical protein